MDVEPRALYEQLLRNEEPVRADDHGRCTEVEPGPRPLRLEDSDPEALRDELGRGCRDPPSPAGPESSIAKLLWSDLDQELSAVAGELLGPDATSGPWGRDRLASRALSIAGGTTQVNKNIVAQRILGLPRG